MRLCEIFSNCPPTRRRFWHLQRPFPTLAERAADLPLSGLPPDSPYRFASPMEQRSVAQLPLSKTSFAAHVRQLLLPPLA